jgi:hypothetical protein
VGSWEQITGRVQRSASSEDTPKIRRGLVCSTARTKGKQIRFLSWRLTTRSCASSSSLQTSIFPAVALPQYLVHACCYTSQLPASSSAGRRPQLRRAVGRWSVKTWSKVLWGSARPENICLEWSTPDKFRIRITSLLATHGYPSRLVFIRWFGIRRFRLCCAWIWIN